MRLFGQMSFSIFYNSKLKPRETKIRLFGPPFKLEKFFKMEQLIKIGNKTAFELSHFYFFCGLLLEIWNLAARKMTYLACKNVNHER